MASTTYGSMHLFDLLVSEASELQILDPAIDPSKGVVQGEAEVFSALIHKRGRSIEMDGIRLHGEAGFCLRCFEEYEVVFALGAPGLKFPAGISTTWNCVRLLEISQSDWFRQACVASGLESFYFGSQPDLLQLVPEKERTDPQSPFMSCFLMNLIKELAR